MLGVWAIPHVYEHTNLQIRSEQENNSELKQKKMNKQHSHIQTEKKHKNA